MKRGRKRTSSTWLLASQIVAERRAVQSRLTALTRQAPARDPAGGAGDNPAVAELVEAAQHALARDLVCASRAVLVSRLEAFARAEAKVREGTYGRCDVCGQPIPVARLRAVPEAVRCVPCAEQVTGMA